MEKEPRGVDYGESPSYTDQFSSIRLTPSLINFAKVDRSPVKIEQLNSQIAFTGKYGPQAANQSVRKLLMQFDRPKASMQSMVSRAAMPNISSTDKVNEMPLASFNNIPSLASTIIEEHKEDLFRGGEFNNQMDVAESMQHYQLAEYDETGERKMEKLKEGEMLNDDQSNNIHRHWKNWVIKTFEPKPPIQLHDAINNVRIPLQNGPMSYDRLKLSGELDKVSVEVQKREKFCDAKKVLYNDDKFPAKFSSLVCFGTAKQNEIFLERLKWARASAYVLSQMVAFGTIDPDEKVDPHSLIKFYGPKISSGDIFQYNLGDCYWMAALASLAAESKRMQRIALIRRYNVKGIYAVNLCIQGVWEEVIVDEKLPVDEEGLLYFSGNNDGVIWPMIFEKAWAKVHGGYMNIEEGVLCESLHALTGAPCTPYFLDRIIKGYIEGMTTEMVWKDALRFHSQWFLMLASTKNKGIVSGTVVSAESNSTLRKREADQDNGLVYGHAYSVLGVYEIARVGDEYKRVVDPEDSNPDNIRLIKLRNPWGNTEWTKDWHDDCEQWNDQISKIVHKPDALDDGIFFMSYTDFLKHFDGLAVCKYREEFVYSGAKVTTSPIDPTLFCFGIPKAGKYSFTISQVNMRDFPKEDNYVYSALTMFIAKWDDFKVVKSFGVVHGQEEHLTLECYCEQGPCIAYIFTPWRRNVNVLGFSIYGPKKIDQLIKLNTDSVPPNFVTQFMFDRVKVQNPPLTLVNGVEGLYMYAERSITGIGYLYFENRTPDTQITAVYEFRPIKIDQQSRELQEKYKAKAKESSPKREEEEGNENIENMYSSFKGVEIHPPSMNNTVELVIPPGRKKIIVYRMTNPKAGFELIDYITLDKNYSMLIGLIKGKGVKLSRLYKEQDVGINQYCLNFGSGTGYFYENTSTDMEFHERIEFNLFNCKLPGGLTGLSVQLRPMKQRLVVFRPIDISQPSNVEVLSCQYIIRRDEGTYANSYKATIIEINK